MGAGPAQLSLGSGQQTLLQNGPCISFLAVSHAWAGPPKSNQKKSYKSWWAGLGRILRAQGMARGPPTLTA